MLGVFLDLITKYIAKILFQENFYIFKDFLYLGYIENKGIAFSIDIPFIKIITILFIIAILYYYIKEEKQKKDKIIDLSFALILAGAIGNGYERIFNSFVIDFIGVKYFSVFNLADSFIFIGAILYIYKIFKTK